MGQRLVIQIKDGETNLANAYYHWSAYTGSAAELTKEILDKIDEVYEGFTPVQKAVWLLYETGARFAPDEIALIESENIDIEQFSFAIDDKEVNRNDGLLCVSNKGMDENTYWEEGRVEIDITNRTVNFDVLCIETAEEYKEYNDEFDELPVFDFDEDFDFTYNQFYEFYDKLMNHLKCLEYVGVSKDKKIVFEFVE